MARQEQPEKRATLADVARSAGVSTAVVSYVLNKGPRNVSDASRKRVEKAISDLGYRLNPLARALINGKTNLVGMLVPNAANAFFGELAREFEREGKTRGYLTLLGNTSNDPTVESDYAQALGDLHARGVFVTSVNEEGYDSFGCPKIYVHSAPEGARSPSVLFDDFGGGRIATKHLVSLGYKDIYCLAGASGFGPLGERRRGWEVEMNVANLRTEGRAHFVSEDRIEATSEIKSIIDAANMPCAIFATTDEQALATLRAATEVGLKVPADIAIVGFDGISEARLGNVRISTIVLPIQKLAKIAFDALDHPSDQKRHILEGDLWIGETCGAES